MLEAERDGFNELSETGQGTSCLTIVAGIDAPSVDGAPQPALTNGLQ